MKKTIDGKDRAAFEAIYKESLTVCYSCHKAADKPYLRPRVPTEPASRILLSSLQRGLEEKGYEVITAATGEQGYYAATTEPIDAMILDLMLPGRDGIRVLRDLRGKGFTRPVLILTARDAIEDKVLGLDSGADDYLVKPFAFAELLARLRALLRRDVSGRELVLRADDLEVDLLARRVVRDGVELDLTKREYELLEYLLQAQELRGHPRDDLPRRVEGSHRSAHQRHRRLRDASPQEGRATGFSAAHPHLTRCRLLAEGWLMGILSIRWRLTLWYGAVLALVLSIFGGAVYLMMRHALTERAGAGLLMESAEVEQEIDTCQERGASQFMAGTEIRPPSWLRHSGHHSSGGAGLP